MYIPNELVRLIIGYTINVGENHTSCCLVCHQWNFVVQDMIRKITSLTLNPRHLKLGSVKLSPIYFCTNIQSKKSIYKRTRNYHHLMDESSLVAYLNHFPSLKKLELCQGPREVIVQTKTWDDVIQMNRNKIQWTHEQFLDLKIVMTRGQNFKQFCKTRNICVPDF
jgi:hypothetical protein